MSVGERIRQVVIRGRGEIDVVETSAAEPGEGEVRVRTSLVGVCGSDLHVLEGKHPFVSFPVMPGHEVVGVVETVGPGVAGLGVGQRVLVEPNLICGRCRYCRSGRYNLCDQLAVVGFQAPGSLADLFTVPASRLHPVPPSLSDREAALVEPLSTAAHAVRMAGGDLTERTAAILGAGSIGLLTLVAAREAGAAAIAVTDLQPSKRERAVRLGARAAFDARDEAVVERIKEALGGRPDVTFDCVSNQASIDQAIALAQKGGAVIVVGVAAGPVQIPLPIIQDQEIRIEGSAMYVKRDVQRAMDMLVAGAVPVDEIVTATYPLEQIEQAFAAAHSGDEVKVQVRVAG
ncbi:MAG: alcohol dehydrogenase catalytic domain-containing protein [Chloroflexi bacterium]|nr:alcohol dehydrogenase catalytic domain-containing protein [Chloroflexota bacterium]